MNLDLVNKVVNSVKNNKSVQSFIKELKNYREESRLIENKITTKFRDKMLIERVHILNNYANETLDKGEMYYIYSKNSKMEDAYNLCICEEGKSHVVLEESSSKLPNGVQVGSVLRKAGDTYILDEEATSKITDKLEKMKEELSLEQKDFLNSKRIEGHTYEMSEHGEDRAWLFDITSGENEEIEEIDFPLELLKNSKEGDLFVYEDGEYKKYLK